MHLRKRSDGLFEPSYNRDRDEAIKVKTGEEVTASRKRNVAWTRKAFALLHLAHDNQDKYTDFEIFRQVITMKAGFVNFVDGRDGAPHPLPKSISFENMNQQEFEKWYSAIKEVIKKEIKISDKDITEQIENYY